MVSDTATNSRGELRAQVATAQLTCAAENVLKLTSELKIALIAQDVGESWKDDCASKQALDSDSRKSKDELVKLRENTASLLANLERHYYTSIPNVGVHQTWQAKKKINDAEVSAMDTKAQ